MLCVQCVCGWLVGWLVGWLTGWLAKVKSARVVKKQHCSRYIACQYCTL